VANAGENFKASAAFLKSTLVIEIYSNFVKKQIYYRKKHNFPFIFLLFTDFQSHWQKI